MQTTYQAAVLEMIKADIAPDKILSGLKQTLSGRGHEPLYRKILSGVLRELEASSAARSTHVVVKSEADYKTHQKAIQAALKELGTSDNPAISVDPTLIGGFIAEHNNVRMNHSYKAKLVNLYRALAK